MQPIPIETLTQLARNGIKVLPAFQIRNEADRPRPHKKATCTRCYGTGFFVPNNIPTWHESFGRSRPCGCRQISRSSQYLRNSGLTQSEQLFNIEYAQTVANYPRAVNATLSIAKNGTGSMLLYGRSGTGKSGLLMALIATACRNGANARYTTAPQMMSEIKATFDKKSPRSTEQVIQRFIDYQFLAVDEIEKVNMTDYTMETYHRIFDERYRMRRERATCFATNIMPKSIEGTVRFLGQVHPVLGAIDDRFKDAARIKMDGETLRGKRRD